MSKVWTVSVHCVNCGKSIGELDRQEFGFAAKNRFTDVLCFDCDHIGNATFPEPMLRVGVGSVMVVDGQEFWLNRNVNGELRWRTISHVREQARALSCLSSSTYLNTHPNQDGEWEQESENDARCPNCQIGDVGAVLGGHECDTCGSFWSSEAGITLPYWLVSPTVPPGKKYDHGIGCPDCDTVKTLGGVGFCSYHHALLIEQREDGSLGWNRER